MTVQQSYPTDTTLAQGISKTPAMDLSMVVPAIHQIHERGA